MEQNTAKHNTKLLLHSLRASEYLSLCADTLTIPNAQSLQYMIYADLHSHTTASDGSLPPSILVQRAFEKGIKVLAVTDHDTIAGVQEAQAAALERHLCCISGIEISSSLYQEELHILGYGINIHNSALAEYTHIIRRYRHSRVEHILAWLYRNHHIRLTIDDVQAIAGTNAVLGRHHIAAALCQHGIVDSRREAFTRYLSDSTLLRHTQTVYPAEEAIALIHHAGGVAILAHPSEHLHSDSFTTLLRLGIDGLEVYHPSHCRSTCILYTALAKQYKLLITGGSDFHGSTSRDTRNLGRYGLTKPDFQAFLSLYMEKKLTHCVQRTNNPKA
ncbi:MAG: PHP domain-containing protein [Bacteroidota bacterium]|nr:PHP domain-containing protein [Candidatus Kapabacteria bacterium]MDW8220456.1 PHP domain-containing protein [Bacteroidota bacterium]